MKTASANMRRRVGLASVPVAKLFRAAGARAAKPLRGAFPIAFFLLLMFPVTLRAQKQEDFDEYKLRVTATWFYSSPSGSIQGSFTGDSGPIDLQKDLGFSSYSTFSGKVDWKFTRKNHFYVAASPLNSSRQVTLTRGFTFQGQTFQATTVINTDVQNTLIAPGYQYDFIRRKRGHLGIGVQFDLFDSSAKMTATAQIVNGQPVGPLTANGSFLAPIPVAGPDFRLYLTNSSRVFVEGNVYGMYFGGYGNFVSTTDSVGVTIKKHFSVTAGYQLGSRLVVDNNNSSKRIGLRLTQKGAVGGLQFSF